MCCYYFLAVRAVMAGTVWPPVTHIPLSRLQVVVIILWRRGCVCVCVCVCVCERERERGWSSSAACFVRASQSCMLYTRSNSNMLHLHEWALTVVAEVNAGHVVRQSNVTRHTKDTL